MCRESKPDPASERSKKKDLKHIDFQKIIAITNRHLCSNTADIPKDDCSPFLRQIRRICAHHPKALILREKDLSEQEYETLATKVLSICRDSQVPCILHYYATVAAKLGVTAIHLPLWKFEENPAYVQKHFTTIGISTHSLEEALQAEKLGATYLTAGHLFSTACKEGVPPRGLAYLQEVCQTVAIPVYGLGGIHLDSAQIQEVLGQGAAGVCLMSQLMKIT